MVEATRKVVDVYLLCCNQLHLYATDKVGAYYAVNRHVTTFSYKKIA